MKIRPLLLALTLLILPLAPAAGQDWQTAVEAYERGDYAKALEFFRPLAEQGEVEAQFSLGRMLLPRRVRATGLCGSRPLAYQEGQRYVFVAAS